MIWTIITIVLNIIAYGLWFLSGYLFGRVKGRREILNKWAEHTNRIMNERIEEELRALKSEMGKETE